MIFEGICRVSKPSIPSKFRAFLSPPQRYLHYLQSLPVPTPAPGNPECTLSLFSDGCSVQSTAGDAQAQQMSGTLTLDFPAEFRDINYVRTLS